MCGICGYAADEGIPDEVLERMNNTMYHRGPNDAGIWQDRWKNGAIGMGQRRLSIQDLSLLGHQPMFSSDNNIIVVFNGEIYNYPNLKAELAGKGYAFKSHCDTEVIIAAYQEWGRGCFEKLEGMFAIAIFDKCRQELILARDRIGKKPLYYYHRGKDFVFASELKPIMEYPRFEKRISKEMLGKILCNKYIESPFSIFEETFKVQPGTYLVFNGMQPVVYSYWDIVERKNIIQRQVNGDSHYSYIQAVNELDGAIYESVKARLIADVPIGTFLSGGIDSALVTAMAQKAIGEPIRSFSIGFYDKERNEAPFAAEISKHIGTRHTELYVDEKEILEMIQDLPYYYDEPFSDSSQLPTMLVSRLASDSVAVALSGDGGDELFCGYKMYDWTKIAQRTDWMGTVASHMPGMGWIKKSVPPEVRAFLNNRDADYKTQLFTNVMEEEASRLLGNCTVRAKFPCEKQLKYANWQERRMLLDMQTYLPDEVLAKTDRASMKYSLEVRCPILDYQVIEKSFAIPHAFKYNKGDKKHILKEVAYRYVPKGLLDRPKKGFGVPLRKWLRTVLKNEVQVYTDEIILKRQGIFVPEAVKRLVLMQEKSDKIMYSSMLWSFYVFQMWYQRYIEDLWSFR